MIKQLRNDSSVRQSDSWGVPLEARTSTSSYRNTRQGSQQEVKSEPPGKGAPITFPAKGTVLNRPLCRLAVTLALTAAALGALTTTTTATPADTTWGAPAPADTTWGTPPTDEGTGPLTPEDTTWG